MESTRLPNSIRSGPDASSGVNCQLLHHRADARAVVHGRQHARCHQPDEGAPPRPRGTGQSNPEGDGLRPRLPPHPSLRRSWILRSRNLRRSWILRSRNLRRSWILRSRNLWRSLILRSRNLRRSWIQKAVKGWNFRKQETKKAEKAVKGSKRL